MGQEQVAVVAESSGSASASMLNSGNFVIYNSDQGIIWQSFDHPTDTLLPSQRLFAGHEIVSSISETQHSTGIFRLKMQTGGNLVQYPVDTSDTAPYSYFATGAGGLGDNVTQNFDANGHLYLLNATGFNIITNLTNGGYPTEDTIYLMRLDADGIFRIYSHHLKQKGIWSIVLSSSNDVCNPKGCERNFIAESCKNKNGDITYDMQEVANTVWEDVSYSVLTMPYKDSCAQACLADCNCEAVLFKDGKCKKQRLPLRYGRRQLSDSNIALIKVKLEKVIDGFREEIGRGSFGAVFKGTMSNGQKVVAVKRLEKVLAEGEREFQTEMKVIGKTHHRNLIPLLGVDWNLPEEEVILEEWAYHCFAGDLAKLLGDEEADKKQVERMVK
ncbi:hypothetical protein FH972_002844 [Carpinus fangiana]|uniref:Protein kinase domain-containing protein n=1 Tax=Carpinus fangiana TaxID=176857 RepID=A0A5N6QGM1_9ROSI|nr:hypothetical protein FH972_002844 [Carpinus fangiana]